VDVHKVLGIEVTKNSRFDFGVLLLLGNQQTPYGLGVWDIGPMTASGLICFVNSVPNFTLIGGNYRRPKTNPTPNPTRSNIGLLLSAVTCSCFTGPNSPFLRVYRKRIRLFIAGKLLIYLSQVTKQNGTWAIIMFTVGLTSCDVLHSFVILPQTHNILQSSPERRRLGQSADVTQTVST